MDPRRHAVPPRGSARAGCARCRCSREPSILASSWAGTTTRRARLGEPLEHPARPLAFRRRCACAMLMTAIMTQISATMSSAAADCTWWPTTTAVAPTPSPIDPRPRIAPLNPPPRRGAGGAAAGPGGAGAAGPWYAAGSWYGCSGCDGATRWRPAPGGSAAARRSAVDPPVDLLADALDEALGDGRVIPWPEFRVGGHGRCDLIPLVGVHAHTLCRNWPDSKEKEEHRFCPNDCGYPPAARRLSPAGKGGARTRSEDRLVALPARGPGGRPRGPRNWQTGRMTSSFRPALEPWRTRDIRMKRVPGHGARSRPPGRSARRSR